MLRNFASNAGILQLRAGQSIHAKKEIRQVDECSYRKTHIHIRYVHHKPGATAIEQLKKRVVQVVKERCVMRAGRASSSVSINNCGADWQYALLHVVSLTTSRPLETRLASLTKEHSPPHSAYQSGPWWLSSQTIELHGELVSIGMISRSALLRCGKPAQCRNGRLNYLQIFNIRFLTVLSGCIRSLSQPLPSTRH